METEINIEETVGKAAKEQKITKEYLDYVLESRRQLCRDMVKLNNEGIISDEIYEEITKKQNEIFRKYYPPTTN